jgi:hypothetical protein
LNFAQKLKIAIIYEDALKEFPFPTQLIQTDLGGEFFNIVFQRALMDWEIKFSPIHLSAFKW